MNARKRVELLFFVDLLQKLVEDGSDDVRKPQSRAAIAGLQATRKDLCENPPFAHGEAAKMVRRLARLRRDTVAQFQVPGQPVAGFGLVVYVMLRDLTESEYLAFAEGSALHTALDLILEPLTAFANAEEGRLEEAERKAGIAFRAMKAAGYLQGFEPGGAS